MQDQEMNHLKQRVDDLLQEALKQGATAAEAGLSLDNGLSVTARLGDVETIEHHCDQSLGVTVYIGQKKGRQVVTICPISRLLKPFAQRVVLPGFLMKISIPVCPN
jgi:PmbA protein